MTHIFSKLQINITIELVSVSTWVGREGGARFENWVLGALLLERCQVSGRSTCNFLFNLGTHLQICPFTSYT